MWIIVIIYCNKKSNDNIRKKPNIIIIKTNENIWEIVGLIVMRL